MFACDTHKGCGLVEYVGTILKHSALSKSVFIYAAIYSNRIISKRCDILPFRPYAVQQLTTCEMSSLKITTCAHCLFLGSLMIAFKFTHDNCYKLKYWSEWAGMCKADIVSLELLTLQALNYELVVGNDDFDHWARAYSERCRQPHSSSLTAAVIVYVLVVRRMKSTTSVPQDMPASPTVFGRSDSRQSFGSETSEGNDSYPSTPDSAIGTSDISIDFGETRFGTASVYHDTLYGKHVNVAPCHSTPAIQPTCYTNATSARYHEVMQYMSRHGSRYMPYAKHAYTSQYV